MATPTRCPRCGRENDPGFASCPGCGQPLRGVPAAGEVPCASCGAPLRPGFRFCGSCGRAVGGARPPARPRLTVLRVDGSAGASHPLAKDEVVCGRTEGDVRLPGDPTISPRHARFTQTAEGLRVEDLGSVNGTFLRIRAARRVSVGEEIRVGRQVLRLEPLPRPAAAADRAARAWGSRDAGARYRLSQLLEGGGLGEIFPLREGDNVVGREAGEVTFPSDRYVSARHARLEVRGDAITLSDAGSSNGTFVKIVGPAELAPGDELLVGGQLLRVDG